MAWKTNPDGLVKRSKRAMGEWLSLPEWDWFTTHTFKDEYVSRAKADKAWYAWFDTLRLTAVARGLTPDMYGEVSPYYFRVVEYQDRGTLHYHALIGGVGDIRRLHFKDWWELNGFARVVKYEAGKGANFYVGKYLAKDDGGIRFSNNLRYKLDK